MTRPTPFDPGLLSVLCHKPTMQNGSISWPLLAAVVVSINLVEALNRRESCFMTTRLTDTGWGEILKRGGLGESCQAFSSYVNVNVVGNEGNIVVGEFGQYYRGNREGLGGLG